jgi:Baseplate J-like protein
MIYNCCNEGRKAAVLGYPAINGIDYLELATVGPAQRTLLITCLNPLGSAGAAIKPNNIFITGGESITSIGITWVAPASSPPPFITPAENNYFSKLPNVDNVLIVRLDNYGDFSPYTLQFVNDAGAAAQSTFPLIETLSNFDPQLASVTFSFKVECGPDFDCAPVAPVCPPQLPTPPPINYLAKDYTTFRQVMLDRMNQLLPSWGATSEADIGVMLAEVVSYACDQLSYRQDAVTTEAYLNTARSRISLRRHARLVDYLVSEGVNARAWVQVNVSPAATAPVVLPRHGVRFYTTMPGMPASLTGLTNEQAALNAGVVVFEPIQEAELYPELNLMNFYTWGDTNCCLPQGATEATLQNSYTNLAVGDVLIFQEVLGPGTGVAGDADIRHRCAVRLTAVATTDAAGATLVDPLFDTSGNAITSSTQTAQQVTEIRWSTEDALPFPVCISATYTGADNKQVFLKNVSVVFGNVVLADQGLSMPPATLGTVPPPSMFYAPGPGADRCTQPAPSPLPVRFNPTLAFSPLTWTVAQPLTGSPSTPNPVPLSATAPVSFPDNNGFITLQVSADDPSGWPQFFGVVASSDSSGEFDLSVVFAPLGGAAGMSGQVVLEKFTGLSLTTGSSNYAGTVLAASQFIHVDPSTPSITVPTQFPSTPTYLGTSSGASGPVDLQDTSGTTYLILQVTNPRGWPPLFSVVSQQQVAKPQIFNLLLLYTPPSGLGVPVPVIVEQFLSLDLSTIGQKISAASDLISVETFEGEPNRSLSAADLMQYSANQATPAVEVTSNTPGTSDPTVKWSAVPDLLGAGPDDTQFVVEIDTDGTASLRFGDGTNGKQPVAGDVFTARYRVGNGTAGNVGANSLVNWTAPATVKPAILSCTNPLPAAGGVDPETAAQIIRRAPQAFMTQERAITMQDYVNAVETNSLIEDAAATARWTGAWYTVFIAAEPQANASMSKALRRSLTATANQYRLAGEAVYVEPPQYVPLTVSLTICVDPDYFALDVEQNLKVALGSCMLPDGTPAFFAPSNFELGQPVYLSPIYTAARAVPGVMRVTATVFEPQGQNTRAYLNQGYIPMGPFQVARLDNDPSLPANGRLSLTMEGGK